MKRFAFTLLVILSLVLGKQHPEARLKFMDYCQAFNYPVEEYNYNKKRIHYQTQNTDVRRLYSDILSDSGQVYNNQAGRFLKTFIILTIQGLPPIYLQHGLLDCSDTFIINEEVNAPAFILANRGYDVWLGNNRGNTHSREHITLNPNKSEFWQFTFEDMAIYDIPAGFKLIYEKTHQDIIYIGSQKFINKHFIKLIGHSQGTIQMHAQLALFDKSFVRDHLKQFIGLGPVAFVSHQNSQVINLLLKTNLEELLDALGVNEFFLGETWLVSDFGRVVCGVFPTLCGDIVGSIVSADKNLDNYERYDVLAGHDPGGTSVKNLKHWKQLAQSGKFTRYDYGENMNLKIYGQPTAPEFNLKNINIPQFISKYSGKQDLLADPQDVQILLDHLVNSPKKWAKFYDAGHCSYMWGKELHYLNDLWDILEGRQ